MGVRPITDAKILTQTRIRDSTHELAGKLVEMDLFTRPSEAEYQLLKEGGWKHGHDGGLRKSGWWYIL